MALPALARVHFCPVLSHAEKERVGEGPREGHERSLLSQFEAEGLVR